MENILDLEAIIMMKKIIAGAMLALPLAITAMPAKASAMDAIANPHAYNFPSAPVTIAYRHKRWVAGHWEWRNHHRHWVAGHWMYY